MTRPISLEALVIDIAGLRRRHIDHHPVGTDLPVAWLRDVLASTDAEVADPGRVDLQLHLQPRGVVVVTGTLTVAFEVPCGRCLALAGVHETAKVTATYIPAGAAAAAPGDPEEGLGLSPDDLDTWTHEGASLSLDAMVAEHVKVAYPMRVLCTRGEACRGLCSNCGADLNPQAEGSRTCDACGRPVPLTPVADLPSEVGAAGASEAVGEAAPAPDPDAPESPLAAALKKWMS